MRKSLPLVALMLLMSFTALRAEKKPEIAPSYAWRTIAPLGLHDPAVIDTAFCNYAQRSVPSDLSPAYAITGNLGAEGLQMIYFDRPAVSDFYFHDALAPWLPSLGTHTYYNTRIPMTLLSYNTGGGRDNAQDRLSAVFSGNVGPKLQIGANFDYLYSKGSYDNQAAKSLTWGFSGSYIGDRYELQAFYNHWNSLNKENGGITDDLYITDPAELQGGQSSINAKTIPTNLSDAHTRVVGGEFYMNHRYKVGYWKDEQVNDTTTIRTYVPVSSFIWTMDYRDDKHLFYNTNQAEAEKFWKNTYLNEGSTRDRTTYWSLRNTFGISMIEGFHKRAKFGLAAYVTHEYRKYGQTADTVAISGPDRPAGLTPYPFASRLRSSEGQNLMWVGGQLTKQHGSLLTYEATAEFGLVGAAAGEVKVDGHASARFRMLGDTVTVKAYGLFHNVSAPFLMNHYISNHFAWDNDFGKTRRFRAGGELVVPWTSTRINVGVENIQNMIYFGSEGLPVQHSGSVQVFSASLVQNIRAGILHWDNRMTYQTSSVDEVLPLPKFAIYSNLYLKFKVARVLDVQFGLDCDYYTRYYAPAYQPATVAFCNQREIMCGNYPFMNLYANFKLSRARFYVMMSHINQGLTGKNYFSMPHYPLNPRRFQMGVSIDFAN